MSTCFPFFYVHLRRHAIIIINSVSKSCEKHFSTWEHRILIDMLKFYAWFYVWANSMPESVDFCWFYICHNDYQELCCIVETDRLLLSVPLPGFDILVLHARTFFLICGEDSLCLSKKQNKQLFFTTHSRSHLLTRIKTTQSKMWIMYVYWILDT